MLLEMLQQGAAYAVDDTFWLAGGAGRIKDIERIVEAHGLEAKDGVRLARQHLLPVVAQLQGIAEQGDQHCLLYAVDLADHAGHLGLDVDGLAVVAIAVHRKQHPGPGLAEALHHAGLAKVGAGGGPDSAQAGGCQHGHHGFRDIGQVGRHHVATAYALAAQPLGQPGHLIRQFTPAQGLAGAAFDAGDNGRALILTAQQVFGKVEPAVGEPAGALHILAVLCHYVAEFPFDTAVLPHQRPEASGLFHRPLIELGIAVQLQAVEAVDLAHKLLEIGLLNPVLIRLPQAKIVHE